MDQTLFFLDASKELKAAFEKGFVVQHLKSGEMLFDQGEHDDRLWVLDKGLLEVSVYSVSGRKLSLNMLRPGSVFGEIALFDPGLRTANVAALKPSSVRSVRKSTLIAGIKNTPALAEELLGFAGKRMRWLTQQVEDQVFLAPVSRLAAKVIYLSGESGTIHMSQAQLADYVGVTREFVSTHLAEWRRDGVLEVSRGRIDVRDMQALEEIQQKVFF